MMAVFREYLEFCITGVGLKCSHLLPVVETSRVIKNGIRTESILFWIVNMLVCMKRLRLKSLNLIVFM